MPINTNLYAKCAAIWTYIPNEDLDFSKFYFVKLLRIECFQPTTVAQDDTPRYHRQTLIRPLSTMSRYYHHWNTTDPSHLPPPSKEDIPYTLPSLKRIFPNLETLIISNGNQCFKPDLPVYLHHLTDIPSTVKNLDIEYTRITNLGDVIHTCTNLQTLKLNRNIYQIDIHELRPLPPNLVRLHIYLETLAKPIHAPDSLLRVQFVNSTIPFLYNFKYTPDASNIIMYGCDSPYDNNIFINHSEQDKIQHIHLVNAHQVYQHFGSIPSRIRISSPDDLENPIVVALNLASNYPRRFAEFITPQTPTLLKF